MKARKGIKELTNSKPVGFIKNFLGEFSGSSVSMLSNGMVYSTLIAVVPCLALIYAVLNIFGVLDPVMSMLENYIIETFGDTTGKSLVGYLNYFTQNAVSMGIVSILSFGVTFVLLIDKIYSIVNKIYHVPKGKKLVVRYLKYVLVIAIGLAAIVLAVFSVGKFNSLSLKLRNLPDLSGFQKVVKAVLPFIVLFVLMLALVYLMPNCKVRFLSGLIGAAVGAVGVGVLGMVFKFVVQRSVKYSVIYGSLATLMFFFLFLSYLWKLVFASVIVSYVHQKMTTGIKYES